MSALMRKERARVCSKAVSEGTAAAEEEEEEEDEEDGDRTDSRRRTAGRRLLSAPWAEVLPISSWSKQAIMRIDRSADRPPSSGPERDAMRPLTLQNVIISLSRRAEKTNSSRRPP